MFGEPQEGKTPQTGEHRDTPLTVETQEVIINSDTGLVGRRDMKPIEHLWKQIEEL